jgi:hypothetical protein
MSNKELQLFVFEGGRAESKYVEKLEQNFLGKGISVKCVFDAEIYQLYKLLEKEYFDFDMVELLKERSKDNAELLKDYTRDSFAYIYLFFDYDAHSTLADDSKIVEMLHFFDNETENGLLYISYPMVEAIRHYKDLNSFKDLTVKCKRANCPYKSNCEDVEACMNEPHYKTFSATDCRPQLNNINKYTKEVWQELIRAHVSKMNYIVNGVFEFPIKTETQNTIFDKQLAMYINHKCPEVAVLSALPIYVLDYYGAEALKRKTDEL